MTTIQIFNPALCCSTGVCGVDVERARVTFATDVDWLKSMGVRVVRANLAQQPQAFAGDARIRRLLQAHGDKARRLGVPDADVRRAGIEPWARVINASLAMAWPSAPLLRRRAQAEVAQIDAVRSRHARRLAVLPLLADEPVGKPRPLRLLRPEPASAAAL
jgi:hypothetical protein